MVHCTGRKCPFFPRGVGSFGWRSSSANAETFPRQKYPFQAMPSHDHIVIPATGQAHFDPRASGEDATNMRVWGKWTACLQAVSSYKTAPSPSSQGWCRS